MRFVLASEQILQNVISYLYTLDLDEVHPQEIVIKDFRKKRTEAQNALYWSWLRIISRETGNSVKILHAFFGDKFLGKEFEVVRGEEVESVQSTTDLSPKEFTKYLMEVESDTVDFHGITLPHPGELEW